MSKDKLTININIGERIYPINIARTDNKREELIRKSAQSINDALFQYKNKGYKGKDEQDYMAMVLISFAVKLLEMEEKEDISPIINELKKVNFEIENFLERE
ncbi:MAG: cell division protein ZapA [Bacteroidales bacterium]|jgi:cell division protein ZapA|nr:cell division protein ZapA [Bacteroidales bacterium]MCK9498259.1 cell division protein ZapA [Bacteroidales bacterium]MDY0313447.1 cell division protein ZapA [Bacteroidales bacterium]NLB86139.1 cell division protein ZapA [Bacteroidales bacterium]